MSTDHHAATAANRIETATAEYYLPATPSETLVAAVSRFTDFLKHNA